MIETLRGPGIFYLDGRVECPLASVGTRGPFASNRLVLDDEDSEAKVDAASRTIVVVNRRRYERQTLIGDFIALGTGTTREGPVRFAIHVRFDKKGTTVRARPHLHPTVTANLRAVTIEPFKIIVSNGSREVLAFDEALAHRAATSPPTSDWLGRALLSVRAEATGHPRIAALVVRVGIGPLGRDVVRVEAFSRVMPDNRSLKSLLLSGDWELRLTALASLRSLREHLGRAMFLLGLGEVSVLREIASGGIQKGETLTFRQRDGRGTVSLGAGTAEIPNVADVARAFLELDFLGAILAHELASSRARAHETESGGPELRL